MNKTIFLIWKNHEEYGIQAYFYKTWKEAVEDIKRFRKDVKILSHADYDLHPIKI